MPACWLMEGWEWQMPSTVTPGQQHWPFRSRVSHFGRGDTRACHLLRMPKPHLQPTLPGPGHWRRGGSAPRSWQLPVGRWSWWGRGHWSPWSAGCWRPGRTCVSCWGQWRSGASWRSSCLPPGAGPPRPPPLRPAWSTVPGPPPPPQGPAPCHSLRRQPSTACPSPSAAWRIHSAVCKGKEKKRTCREWSGSLHCRKGGSGGDASLSRTTWKEVITRGGVAS